MKNASLWNVLTSASRQRLEGGAALCKAKSHGGWIAWPRCKDVPGAINATDGLTGRMRNVIKNALRAAQPATQQQRRRV